MRILVLVGGIAAVIVVLAATAFAAAAGGTSKTIRVVEHATTDAVTETGHVDMPRTAEKLFRCGRVIWTFTWA